MDSQCVETGSRIMALRKNQGLSREKLAEMANISVQFLADIEKGKKNMTVTTLRKLAAALVVTTDYIVNGTDDTTNHSENELINLCKALSPQQQGAASRLIRIFIEELNLQNPYMQ